MRPEPPAPACLDNPWPYDVLIDEKCGDERRRALRSARTLCGSCPLQLTCLAANREEAWAAAILGVDKRKPAVIRKICGTTTGRRHHSRHNERPCDPCKEAETRRRASERAKKRALSNVPDELRAAHAAHWRLQKQGVAKEDMPADVINGERAYQARRKRKARGKEEAA